MPGHIALNPFQIAPSGFASFVEAVQKGKENLIMINVFF